MLQRRYWASDIIESATMVRKVRLNTSVKAGINELQTSRCVNIFDLVASVECRHCRVLGYQQCVVSLLSWGLDFGLPPQIRPSHWTLTNLGHIDRLLSQFLFLVTRWPHGF